MWRQNTGVAWMKGRGGKPRPVSFSFPGAPDIMGWIELPSRKEGVPHAVFMAVETKQPKETDLTGKVYRAGELNDNQIEFGNKLTKAGGIYIVCTSVEELDTKIKLVRALSASMVPQTLPVDSHLDQANMKREAKWKKKWGVK